MRPSMASTNGRNKPPKAVFLATTVVIFFLSLSAADSVGFVPCYIDGTDCAHTSVALADLPELGPSTSSGQVSEEPLVVTAVESVLPERIVIPTIDLDLPVQNPSSRNIARLDELLKDGPVRYVDSARLGQKGNVLIFAHTSHLPVVRNQMYKAFNRLPELKAGDSITITGSGKSYVYVVTSVRKAEVDEAVIDLSAVGQKLTLVTCDTLTGKSARIILEADFVGAF